MPYCPKDKAKRGEQEGLCYVRDVQPGDEIPYSHLIACNERESNYHEEPAHGYVRCTVLTATECGDYSSRGLVSESNYRCLKSEFPWLVEIYGPHGYKALAYLGKRENQSDALIEAIDSLDSYPVYSDDDYRELETERESEEWLAHGIGDFKRKLVEIFDEIDWPATCAARDHNACECRAYDHDPDLLTDDDLTELWYDGVQAFSVDGGSGYRNEHGDSIHFYIAEWFIGYSRRLDRKAACGTHEGESFADRMRTLAIACRTHDTDPALESVAHDAWLQEPNGDRTIALINQIPPDFHAAILYAWERQRTEHERAANAE